MSFIDINTINTFNVHVHNTKHFLQSIPLLHGCSVVVVIPGILVGWHSNKIIIIIESNKETYKSRVSNETENINSITLDESFKSVSYLTLIRLKQFRWKPTFQIFWKTSFTSFAKKKYGRCLKSNIYHFVFIFVITKNCMSCILLKYQIFSKLSKFSLSFFLNFIFFFRKIKDKNVVFFSYSCSVKEKIS